MAQFKVTLSELLTSAADIKSANEDFLAAATALKNAADTLASTCQGEAMDVLTAEHAEIDSWYRQMNSAVNDYAAMLSAAAEKYATADRDGAATIRAN